MIFFADVLVAALLGLVFGLLAYRLRMLDASGAVAGGLFGASLVGLGGWAWIVPAFTFFLTSSLLSKVGARRKAAAQQLHEKGSVRDVGQVLANGGVGWALLVAHAVAPAGVWYAGFLGAFAAAAADTWATEVGLLARGRPRLLLTGRLVPRGTSGAVSVPGTIGAFLGALVVWLSALPVGADRLADVAAPAVAAGVVLGGFVASLIDSLAGMTVQARYRDAGTGAETERAVTDGRPNTLVQGYRWVDNDAVNVLATLCGAVIAMACFLGWNFAS